MKIFKILFILILLLSISPVNAKPAMRASQKTFSASVEEALIDTPKESADSYAAKGDKILNYYEKLEDKTGGEKYLISAKYFYYQANRVDISNKNALVGRARVALLQNRIRDAKNNLYMALNFDENNPKVNFYLGETFFQDGEFSEAIRYYTEAYTHGYRLNYRTNLKLGISYEKLDDTQRAKYYYNNAIKIDPSQSEARLRLQGLDIINTGYDDYETYRKEKDETPVDEEDLKGLPVD